MTNLTSSRSPPPWLGESVYESEGGSPASSNSVLGGNPYRLVQLLDVGPTTQACANPNSFEGLEYVCL